VYPIVVRTSDCPQSVLPSDNGYLFLIHHRCIAMAEGMESATPNPELFEQRIELPFPNRIRVPWRSIECESSI